MPSVNNSYSFCADYSAIVACFAAIETQHAQGSFDSHPDILNRIKSLELDLIKKLYNRTLKVLDQINGTVDIPIEELTGDFSAQDFSEVDFNTGFPGYSSKFQTIINIFSEFCSRSAEINEATRLYLDYALIPVLDAFEELKDQLDYLGLNPCNASESLYRNNSPNLYLQAAGSDGAGGIAEGIHLRWSLTGEIGQNHIPKGPNAISAAGFNQIDDYVHLSRTPYTDPLRITLDFETAKPVINLASKQWTYLISSAVGSQILSNKVRLVFKDTALYNQLAVATDPVINPYAFLKSYSGIIELGLSNKPAFAIGFDFHKEPSANSGILKTEILSAVKTAGVTEDTITIRETLEITSGNNAISEIFGENIHTIRFKKTENTFIKSFSFETYHDFSVTRGESAWSAIGSGFALSLDNNTVLDRLEKPGSYEINNLWPHYNEGTTVKVANYQDKWNTSRTDDPSIKATVEQYLNLSETDPRAEEEFRAVDADPASPGLIISYVDVLNLLALDYHIARMLGLGHIDNVSSLPGKKFIYRVSYQNRKSLNSTERITQEFLSLPTSKSDHRLPSKPKMRPISYELPIKNDLSASMFDVNGYANVSDIRVINIGREPFEYERTDDGFFDGLPVAGNFNIFEDTRPVVYGIEYRSSGDNSYVKPELTAQEQEGHLYYAYDSANPAEGVLETVPVPDNLNSLYIHFEKQSGVHHYAIYGINWLFRTSPSSNEASTNATVFQAKNTLLPPTDVAAQYIQKEDNLLFTTTTEQNWLVGRQQAFPNLNAAFTRMTFNWLDITDISHIQNINNLNVADIVKPAKVQAFFKPDQPVELKGIVKNLIALPGAENMIRLQAGGYELLDGSVIEPTGITNDYTLFTGSLFTTEEGQFEITNIIELAGVVTIDIKKSFHVENIEDPEQPGRYASREYYKSPKAGGRFSIIENLSVESNWNQITKTIDLIDFTNTTDPLIETYLDSEGNETHYLIGGISANALVTEKLDVNGIPVPKYYEIEFESNFALGAHPQVNLPFDSSNPQQNSPAELESTHVEWYKGLIRMSVNDIESDKKLLEVMRIDQLNPLVVTVYDPTAGEDPGNNVRMSSSPTDQIGVNFHPGYRAYLFPEPAPANTFNAEQIEPGTGENTKKTLLGLQTLDTPEGGSDFSSGISAPVILMARNIVEPLTLEAPSPLNLVVRPDAIGKAAFTFDMRIPQMNGADRNPFGFMFYRISNQDILEALYAPETVLDILNDLDNLDTDLNHNERYIELANLVLDPTNPGRFRIFDALPQPYGFPEPNRASLTEPGDSESVKVEKYKRAIQDELLPLTEQPPIYSFIKTGLQTDNKLPVIKDSDGNFLDSSDPEFDPFPMIRKFTIGGDQATRIRVTDYSLRASSRYLYFYAGAEITNQLVPGPLSSFTGPVSILFTIQDEAPVIRGFSIGDAISLPESPIAVTFQVSAFLPGSHISRIRLYRSLDIADTPSLSTMAEYADADITINEDSGIQVTDTFDDLATVPFGETLYYRLASLRTIVNEKGEIEEIVSKGSEVIAVRLIDTLNPTPPQLSYVEANNTLTWEATVNKGTYSLYQQNNRGNWEKLFQVQSPQEGSPMEYTLPGPLLLADEDGDRIYHRFKVKVENSSGLLNLTENELTI